MFKQSKLITNNYTYELVMEHKTVKQQKINFNLNGLNLIELE